ncbi:MAG: PQQ-binding-like beta-propeller repeat protein, partial [Planctomycetaceae bacterium]|nr:PQQ-binding-like beta-propeller repeat protein [Planctomycetaceae bacterium]
MTKTCQTYCWLSCLLLGIVFSYIDSTRAAEQSPAFSPFLKTAEDQPQDPQDRLVVDVDFDLRRKIETLDSLIAEKREIEAAVAMQSIFDHPNDFLLITGNQKEEYVSLKKQFLSWSSTLPAPILQAYELQFGPKAQHLLQTYDQTQDLKFLQDVSGRMILTRSGGDAAHLLSKIYLDRGRIRESLALVQQLKSIPSQRLRLEPWLMIQEAVCQARLGKLSEACAAAKPAFQNGPVTLGKQQLAYEQFCMQLGLWADDESGQSLQEWIRDLPDWPTFRRDSQRTRMTADFNMVPVPRWSVDLAPHLLGLSGEAGLEMQQAIHSISNNLNSDDYPKVPAWNPVIVNDRIYVSGFDRVACVNTKTGSVEWISATRDGALEFLFNEELKGKYEIARSNRITDSRSGGLLEPSAYVLQQLGWDLTQGALSSDEERIYTVRRSGLATVTMNTGPFLDARTHALIPIDANVLSALDARTGKLLWEIRGDAMRQQEQAMFGHFFLGAPLACPEGLFVMSESGSELFLAQLEPTTGKVLWLQPLTHPQLSITSDRPRRYAGTTPTWLAPLMVCPTNSGTIFAINPASRSIEWMLRYAQPAGPENEAFSPFQIRRQQIRDEVRKISFNADESWQECVAISTGDLILHTPLDSQDLFALDRQTGEVRWVIPRQDGLFVEVGPTGEIFIVGSRQIRCFDILGNDLWQHDLLTSIPSGRGVLRGHVYHLPLKNRDLLSLDVKTGTALAASAGTLEAPLGNLIVSHGNLYSLNGTTLTAIMSDEQLQKIIDPASPELTPAEKLSLDGQRNLHRGNPREGLQKLQESYQLARSSAVARLISEVLLNSNPQSLEIDQSLIEQLADLMISAEHPPEFTVRYLETLRLMNRPVDAYRTLKTLLENDQIREAYVHLPQAREVYLPALAEGFVSDLYAEATNEQRRQIEQLAQAYLDGTPEANRLLTLKPLFSLPGWKVRFTYRVSQLLNSSQFPLLLEQQLIWLQQFGPAEMQPELICRLAALMLEHRDWSAAEIYRSELRTRLAQTVCHEQKTGTQWEAIFNQKYPLASSGLFDPGQIIKPRKFQQTVDPMALGSARGTRRETVPVEISGLTPWVNWNFEVEKTDHLMTAFNERHETQWYLRFD